MVFLDRHLPIEKEKKTLCVLRDSVVNQVVMNANKSVLLIIIDRVTIKEVIHVSW